MSESLKRGLRDRSKRRHFDSDNEEGEPYSYAKSYAKQFVNPSQQLNQEAKLLIKFINNANRYYTQYQQETLHLESDTNRVPDKRETKLPKKEESAKDNSKKNGEGNKTAEADPNRKGKQIYSNTKIKGNQKTSNPKKDDLFSQIRAISNTSAATMLELQKNNSQLKKTNLKQKTKVKQPETNPTPDKQKAGNGLDKSKFKGGESNKPFKRASYHVAIAYHIYVQLGRGKESGVRDPTLASRKLKDEMGKQQ